MIIKYKMQNIRNRFQKTVCSLSYRQLCHFTRIIVVGIRENSVRFEENNKH